MRDAGGPGGWSTLLATPWPRGDGAFPFPAYSEFMPPPLVGHKPLGGRDHELLIDGDDHGWRITAREQAHELGPGLAALAAHLAPKLVALARDRRVAGWSRDLIEDNMYLPRRGPRPTIAIVPLALSRTQDDKGRVRWTLLGGSDLGPGPAFWSGFRRSPDQPDDDRAAAARLAPLIAAALDDDALLDRPTIARLRAAGVRVLPAGPDPDRPDWDAEDLPRAIAPLVIDDHHGPRGVRALITFRPARRLPRPLADAVARGAIALVPSPEALVFAGHRGYRALARALPEAMQLPLARVAPLTLAGLRVPQSGWIIEGPARRGAGHGAAVERVRRTHRWQRVRRDADDHAAVAYDARVADALFATDPDTLGLYDKPMARNAQLWTEDYQLILDGPRANRARIAQAARQVAAGGHFGYRFSWPPMQVGPRTVIWHRPLCFAIDRDDGARVIDASAGVLVARARDLPEVRLWPRVDERPAWQAIEAAFGSAGAHEARHDARKLLDARARLGRPLAPSFATRLVTAAADARWPDWLAALPAHADAPAAGAAIARVLARTAARAEPPARPPITFAATQTRAFERRYWATIAELATEQWRAKNNADRVASAGARDLDDLADELARRHAQAIARHRLRGAAIGHHWFRWETDYDFAWSDGWARNQVLGPRERNVICVIPGRNRRQAVVLADHYDTAYMEDVYDGKQAGLAAHTRHAAAGADDNHSATATLLLAADVLMPLSRAGLLERDVWLVHLTGEEFPGDSLGARQLARRMVEGTLALTDARDGRTIDLAGVEVTGALVMDMIAHRDPRCGYRFQIAPGEGDRAMAVALAAHEATERWNAAAARRNRAPARAKARPFKRRPAGTRVPAIAPHPQMVGELRPHWHWSSTVFNTDAQCFADCGVPIVLLMEHYDIDRRGYHDTQDTLANIDLDYGAAIAAIAIEAAAALATRR
jgi:hypothetical protein